MCTVVLPPGVNPIAVNKYTIPYHTILFCTDVRTNSDHVPINKWFLIFSNLDWMCFQHGPSIFNFILKDIWKILPSIDASETRLYPKPASWKIRVTPSEIEPATCRLVAQYLNHLRYRVPLLFDSGGLKLFIHYVVFQVNRNDQQTNNSRNATEQNDTSRIQRKVSAEKQSSKLNPRKEMRTCTESWRSIKTKENAKKTKKHACDKEILMLVKSILSVMTSGKENYGRMLTLKTLN